MCCRRSLVSDGKCSAKRYFLRLDTTSFSLSLGGRSDRGFHSFRQLCLYLRKLAKRVVIPNARFPAKILDLDINVAPALSVTMFLNRIKFGGKLDHACKLKVEVEMHEKQGEKLTLVQLTNKALDKNVRLARSYVTHLFKETRSRFDFTTNIAQALGSFLLEILLKFPLTQATKCFSKLFMSFRLRGYLSATEETQAQDEYLSFVDELRVKFSEFDQPTLLIPDIVDFIMGQTTIQTRPNLLASVLMSHSVHYHPSNLAQLTQMTTLFNWLISYCRYNRTSIE